MGFEGRPVSHWTMPVSGRHATDRLQDSDEFDAPGLGLQWS